MVNLSSGLPIGLKFRYKTLCYTIEKVLGQGSYGITYLASVRIEGSLGFIDTDFHVAIKGFIMHDLIGRNGNAAISDKDKKVYDEYKIKFQQEMQNLSKLKHPNIVKVLETFEIENNVYYVMEYVNGGSLDDLIRKNGRLPVAECVRLSAEICGALKFMHENGMLHLDLKPSNIMMREGHPVLIDFGLSKQYNENEKSDTSISIRCGTPGYTPLEQSDYHGSKGFPVTMDIYALGATMFKMLTGHRVPDAYDILNEGFPEKDLREVKVPEWLCKLIKKCMSPMRKDRYQTVDEVLQILQNDVSNNNDVETVLDDDTQPTLGAYGYYRKYVGEKEYGTFEMKKIAVTDPLPFPDGICIRYKPNNGKGISYDIAIHSKETGRVEIHKDEIKVSSEICPAGIPAAVRNYLIDEGFLSKVHWENEESTTPTDSDFGIFLSVRFIYGNGNGFTRTVEWAHHDWHHIFLDSVEGLLDVLAKCSIIPDKETIDKLSRDIHVCRPLVIAPETNKIVIKYVTESLLGHHKKGSYRITITPNEILGVCIDNISDPEYIPEKKPITISRFSAILSDIQKIGIQIRQKAKDYEIENSDYNPEEFEIVLYMPKGRYASYCQWDKDYGDIVGDVTKFNHKIAVALPELRKCLGRFFVENT